MQIKLEKKFENSFFNIYEYITKDKKSAANKFKANLFKTIQNYNFYQDIDFFCIL